MVAEEKYIFKAETKKKLVILGVVGVVLFTLGVFMAMQSGVMPSRLRRAVGERTRLRQQW